MFLKIFMKCVISLLLIVIFLLKIFQLSNSNDSMTWVSFTNLFTSSIYIAVKRSSSPQGLISIHCCQCKLLSAFVLLSILTAELSHTWGSLMDGSTDDQVWGSLPQRLYRNWSSKAAVQQRFTCVLNNPSELKLIFSGLRS